MIFFRFRNHHIFISKQSGTNMNNLNHVIKSLWYTFIDMTDGLALFNTVITKRCAEKHHLVCRGSFDEDQFSLKQVSWDSVPTIFCRIFIRYGQALRIKLILFLLTYEHILIIHVLHIYIILCSTYSCYTIKSLTMICRDNLLPSCCEIKKG